MTTTQKSSRKSRVVAAFITLVLGLGLAQATAMSASAAARCQDYVDKAGTNVPYSAPPSNWTRGTAYGCSTSSGIGSAGHKGQDYYYTTHNEVAAVATGTVRERGWEYTTADQTTKACHGKYIVVEDAQGVFSIYAHLSDIEAAYAVGQPITRGDRIGYTGDTGSPAQCGVDHIGDHVEIMIAYQWVVTAWGGGFDNDTTKYTDPEVYMSKH